ncbi:UNVERIFIED_CONTAM: Histone-lysine N-methyltransferase SETMAR [Trichonephila clavipes]
MSQNTGIWYPGIAISNRNSYSSEAKWTYQRSSLGVVYFTTSKWAYQPLHQVAEDVKRLGIVLSMNALDDEALQAAIEEDSSQTYGELARQINTFNETVRLHLHRLDFHLFHSLDSHLRGKFFTNEADVQQALTDFFASHAPEFYRKGIEQLKTRWQKVLDGDGDYFED